MLKFEDKNTKASIFDFIVTFSEAHRYPPTVQEIADGIGKSRTNVHYFLDKMRRENRISFERGAARTITILQEPPYYNPYRITGVILKDKAQ